MAAIPELGGFNALYGAGVGDTLYVAGNPYFDNSSAYNFQWWKADPYYDVNGDPYYDVNGDPYWTGSKITVDTAGNSYIIKTADEQYVIGCDMTPTGGGATVQSQVIGIIKGFRDAYLPYAASVINGPPDGTNAYIFPSFNIGPPDPRKKLFVKLTSNAGTAASHTDFTSKSNESSTPLTFTKIEQATLGAAVNATSIWKVAVPTQTQIILPKLQCSAAPARASMHVWIHGRGDPVGTPVGVSASSGTLDLIPNKGMAILALGVLNSVDSNITWTGAVADLGPTYTSGLLYDSGARHLNISGADETAYAIAAATTAGSPTNYRLCAAAFGPREP